MRSSPAARPGRIKALAFDAYGTLFDVFSVTSLCDELFPGNGSALAQLWRAKQLQYTLLRSLMGRHKDFWGLTEDGLVYAANALKLGLTADKRKRLMDACFVLAAFPDVKPGLEVLRKKGLRLGILSNGEPKMLQAAARGAGISGLLDASNNLLLMLFLLVYLCADAERLPARVGAALGPDHPLFARVKQLNDGLRDYMLINGAIGIVVALARTVLLLAMGVDFALLWGVWSLLLTYVPTVGYPLALLPPMLIAFIQHGWQSAALVLVGYSLINVLAYNVLMPRCQGKSLDLSPFVVVVSLIFWGIVLGAMGALLAVPLTLALRSVLESSEHTRWLADLMAGESSDLAASSG